MDLQSPAAIGIHEFELTDAHGRVHRYMVTETPAGEGVEVMFAILSLGAPTVLGLAGAAVKSESMLGMISAALQGQVDGDTSDADYAEVAQAAISLDLPAIGREIGMALASGKMPGITKKLIARVHRDSKALRDPAVFDLAFQANYLELLTLLWKVCTINRFFPVPGTSESSPAGTGPGTATTPTPPPPAT